MRKRSLALMIVLMSFLIIFSVGIAGCSSKAPSPTLTVAEIKSQAQTITYDDLFRNNENYIGKIVYLRGRTTQVFPGSGNKYDLILDTSGLYSFTEGRIYVSDYQGSRFLEGDTIDVWGEVNGLVTLKSVLGKESSFPKITALHAELVKKVSG